MQDFVRFFPSRDKCACGMCACASTRCAHTTRQWETTFVRVRGEIESGSIAADKRPTTLLIKNVGPARSLPAWIGIRDPIEVRESRSSRRPSLIHTPNQPSIWQPQSHPARAEQHRPKRKATRGRSENFYIAPACAAKLCVYHFQIPDVGVF